MTVTPMSTIMCQDAASMLFNNLSLHVGNRGKSQSLCMPHCTVPVLFSKTSTRSYECHRTVQGVSTGGGGVEPETLGEKSQHWIRNRDCGGQYIRRITSSNGDTLGRATTPKVVSRSYIHNVDTCAGAYELKCALVFWTLLENSNQTYHTLSDLMPSKACFKSTAVFSE